MFLLIRFRRVLVMQCLWRSYSCEGTCWTCCQLCASMHLVLVAQVWEALPLHDSISSSFFPFVLSSNFTAFLEKIMFDAADHLDVE